VIDRFINQLRERFVNGIYSQVERQSGGKRMAADVLFGPGIGGMLFEAKARSRIREDLNEIINRAIAEVGGRQAMITWFGLLISGSVAGPIHDIEGRRGVTVTSQARAKPWQTVGDSRLSEGSMASAETRAEAEEAVLAAKDDIDRAYDIGKAEREFQEWVPNATDLPYTVYFRFDRADLSGDARKALVGIPAYMIHNPGTVLVLTGHTDSLGKQDYNKDLGRRRAQTVLDALDLPEADASRVTAKTRGEENPVTSNPRQAWRNRRVEFVWSERRVSSFPTVEQARTIRAVQQQIGPPYKAERFIPTEAPGQNVALPDWHWGSLPAPLRAEISTYVAAKVHDYMDKALKSSILDARPVDGITIEPGPIARAIIDELLSDPVGFLARAFGEGAGP
jgi:outer membrane protein OmpA-like peptidoglycan-associated protein